jgi:acyl-ACP thioesterase
MEKKFTQEIFLTAGQCTPQNELPLQTLARDLIEAATLHANALGVGYSRLCQLGLSWVLSRLSIEMYQWPTVNTTYVIETWVQNHNRRFSERDFRIADTDGNTLGYARSIWMTINTATREGGDLSALTPLAEAMTPTDITMAPMGRTAPIDPQAATTTPYTFHFTDCDNNRHVNTARYIEVMLNLWSMDFFDNNKISRFDIAFHHECHYGDNVEILLATDGDANNVAINSDDTTAVRAVFRFSPR